MPPLSAVPPPASSGWPALAFWLLACPLLVSIVLLGVVTVVALLRAPKPEASKILGIFVSALREVTVRTHRGGGPELDSGAGGRESERGDAVSAGGSGREGNES